MLININVIFICIGTPKPHLRLNSLAAGTFLFLKNDTPFIKMTVCDQKLITFDLEQSIFGIFGTRYYVLGTRYKVLGTRY